MQGDGPLDFIKCPDHQHHRDKRPAANHRHRTIADPTPCFAARLNEDARFRPFVRGISLLAGPNIAPRGCIVIRLRLLALRLTFLRRLTGLCDDGTA